MGKKLPPHEAELYRRCDEILHYIWDPIGVAGAPGARDEYQSYLPFVVDLLRRGEDASAIATYLLRIEQEAIGLGGNRRLARRAAARLVEWREQRLRTLPDTR